MERVRIGTCCERGELRAAARGHAGAGAPTSPSGASHGHGASRSFLCERRRRRIPCAMHEQQTWCHMLTVVVALLGCLLAGCSNGSSSDSNLPSPAVSAARPPSIPPDGITLAALGYLNGPVRQFSLPRTAALRAKVDQPNNVTAVVSSPSPAELSSYLRRALPEAGFMITADSPAANTMTFTGHGWSGSFTGDDRASAVLLRPL
ncbi:MAG: hypothetical protein K0R13_66 [Propionibacteriaceae bacterium]|nr:hypothetical protein [Propionibacteriaceae bacterium]